MDFNQEELQNLALGLQAREEKILFLMQKLYESIPEETKPSRVEKSLNEIFDGWRTLQETRQLRKRLQRAMEKGNTDAKGDSQKVRALTQR